MSDPWDVMVVGSCMIDLISYCPRLPKSGETLKGSDFSIGFGGKGCNQCVAARKLGARSIILSRVGNDSFGRDYIKHLHDLDIPTDHVRITEGITSGMAQITVADNGENQIVIVPGANDTISKDDLMLGKSEIENCKVLMCQMEINQECTLKALEIKSQAGIGKSIFNGAPASLNLDARFYTLPDIFCVNESESEILTGIKVDNLEQANNSLMHLLRRGCKEVIITLGELGALYGVQGIEKSLHIPAEKVTPVDTTGAGDAFIGALGYFLARHPDMKMPEIIKKANLAAAISVQRKGTQESFSSSRELGMSIPSLDH